MTAQEVLNKVVAFMRKQGGPSIEVEMAEHSTHTRCRYRGPQGRRCAVGCLIPDETYEPYMEGLSVKNARVSFKLGALGLHQHEDLLNRLQCAHDYPATSAADDAAWLVEFEKMARRIADDSGLEYPQ